MASRKRTNRLKRVVLRLDAGIYSGAVLDRARKAFSHLATVKIRRIGREQVIELSAIAPLARARLADEFANYSLSCLMVEP